MDHVVFDAEPLIAYYWEEAGADVVEAVIDEVESGRVRASVNTVTCTEVRYVCGRDDPERAAAYVGRVRDWFDVVTAEAVWEAAADLKRARTVPLGDAFTVATAARQDATAFTGADEDFEGLDVEVRRFRSEGV